mmetsp:Transcript_1273/g.2214  ORF Transcript_1273/g.2214 Transcript_1273/m.2214 type:complete len:123 (-) Transcript_1273:252-620(-)
MHFDLQAMVSDSTIAYLVFSATCLTHSYATHKSRSVNSYACNTDALSQCRADFLPSAYGAVGSQSCLVIKNWMTCINSATAGCDKHVADHIKSTHFQDHAWPKDIHAWLLSCERSISRAFRR